ncbi:MAG: flagellar hook-basal body protein [Planctomycetales bacterium]|nr:flagellar hook-basal body protein [Planctomycetales bacterium]
MLSGLYSAATALTVAQHRHEATAHNLAHASVPGYRRITSSTETFESAMSAVQPAEGRGVLSLPDQTDFTSGPVQTTGRSLDVAIQGDGFFAVSTPDGTAYTRNGVFFLQPDGALITADGYRVQDSAGAEIQLPATISPSDITIGNDRSISVAGAVVSQLGVFAFEDNSKLERIGTTLFSPSPEAVQTESFAVVQQGARESSNVSTVDELIQMIAGMRHYEAAQKVLTSIDDSISQSTDPRTA